MLLGLELAHAVPRRPLFYNRIVFYLNLVFFLRMLFLTANCCFMPFFFGPSLVLALAVTLVACMCVYNCNTCCLILFFYPWYLRSPSHLWLVCVCTIAIFFVKKFYIYVSSGLCVCVQLQYFHHLHITTKKIQYAVPRVAQMCVYSCNTFTTNI